MTIQFYDIPAGRRTPGRAIEINQRLASAGLIATAAPRVLAIGQRLAAGTKSALELVPVYSDAEGKTYFGAGSILANMIQTAFRQHPQIRLEAIAVDDAAAGVQATGRITFAGTATKAGVIRIWIGNRYVDVPVAKDDTAADLADALDAASSPELADMPATLVQNGVTPAQVDVTARNDGPCGNAITIDYEIYGVTGITVTVVAMSAGATYPTTLQDALDVVEPESFDIVVVGGLEDATELGRISDHLDLVGAPLEMRGGFAVYATTGTTSAATTLAANFSTSFRMVAALCRGAKTHPWELAALYAAAIAAETDLAMPLNNTELKGLDVPAAADRLSSTEVEAMLWGGVGPVAVGASNKMRIVRTISTYTETEAGTPDDAMLDVQTLRVLEWLRYQLNAMYGAKFSKAKFSDTMIDVVRGEIIAILRGAERITYLHQVEDNLDGVAVERNALDQTQMDCRIPAVVVPGLHKIYSRVDYLKTALA